MRFSTQLYGPPETIMRAGIVGCSLARPRSGSSSLVLFVLAHLTLHAVGLPWVVRSQLEDVGCQQSLGLHTDARGLSLLMQSPASTHTSWRADLDRVAAQGGHYLANSTLPPELLRDGAPLAVRTTDTLRYQPLTLTLGRFDLTLTVDEACPFAAWRELRCRERLQALVQHPLSRLHQPPVQVHLRQALQDGGHNGLH